MEIVYFVFIQKNLNLIIHEIIHELMNIHRNVDNLIVEILFAHIDKQYDKGLHVKLVV